MMCLNNCTYYQIFRDEYHLFLRQTLINCLVKLSTTGYYYIIELIRIHLKLYLQEESLARNEVGRYQHEAGLKKTEDFED